MTTYFLLLAELLIGAAASLAVLHVLSGPLLNLLGRICPDQQAAVFWQSYTRIMLMIAPLLAVLMTDTFTHFRDPMDHLRLALMAVLFGLLVGMHSIGKRLGRFIITPQQPESAT